MKTQGIERVGEMWGQRKHRGSVRLGVVQAQGKSKRRRSVGVGVVKV